MLIQSLCTVTDDLDVDIQASSNIALLTGNLKSVSVTASRIVFNGFSVSAGAALYTDQISIRPPPPGTPLASPPKLTSPFSVSIRANLTEADLNREGPVRDAVEALLRQILATGLSGAIGRVLPREIGGVECVLDSVELCDAPMRQPSDRWGRASTPITHPKTAGGKLMLHARASLSSGRVLRFAVRSGLCTEANGSIVKLSNPELIWRQFSVPMITIDTIGVQLDDTTKLTDVQIDRGVLSGDGILVISPPPDNSRFLPSENQIGRSSNGSQTNPRRIGMRMSTASVG